MGRAYLQHLAEAIALLADPKTSGFVNGMELRVDGGWLADGSWDKLRVTHRKK
jgi:NAD(P)-dependent dehydrogenase (short-subunit alcohol dehydrogenase family)